MPTSRTRRAASSSPSADPGGDRGNGARDAARFYMKAGLNHVDVRIYPDMRHEVHNEQGRDKVLADVSAWLDQFIDPAQGSHFPNDLI